MKNYLVTGGLLSLVESYNKFQNYMVINSVWPSCPCLFSVVLLKRFLILPPSFITKPSENKPYLQCFIKAFSFFYNVLHFDSKRYESQWSPSLNRFVQTHPLTNAIKNQMNSVLS